jgi:uncharacterized protein (TIGR03084 family)
MADVGEILTDLTAEGDALESLVRDLPEQGWKLPTPAEGWTVAHTIAHLAWTDEVAREAATAPDAFTRRVTDMLADPGGRAFREVDDAAAAGAAASPTDLLARWRRGRAELAEALSAVSPGTKLPWFGPPMSAASMATARLMETWAHGRDVADGLGGAHPGGPRAAASLRHVAHLGVRTRDFAYLVNDRTPPAEPFRVELTAPGGELWAWGPEDAAQRVTGPALDFCLLVTRRRHPADLAVVAEGEQAQEWLSFAQAFAGPPGPSRAARGAGV